MNYRIVIADGPTFNCPTRSDPVITGWFENNREWKRIDLLGQFEDIKLAFIDGVSYSLEYDSNEEIPVYDKITGEQLFDEYGLPEVEVRIKVENENLSLFNKPGDITYHTDGSITILMGKPTETELLEAAMDDLMLEVLGGVE